MPRAASPAAALARTRAASAAALVIGLVLEGRDGRMSTWLALVVANAIGLWWAGFGPGRR